MEIEIMDAFKGHNLTIDYALQQQFFTEGTKMVKFSLRPIGLTTTFLRHIGPSSTVTENPISLVALGLLLSGWIIMAIVAHSKYKYIQTLQAKLDSLLFIPQRTSNARSPN